MEVLVAMGFDKTRAQDALKEAKGSIRDALSLLCQNSPPTHDEDFVLVETADVSEVVTKLLGIHRALTSREYLQRTSASITQSQSHDTIVEYYNPRPELGAYTCDVELHRASYVAIDRAGASHTSTAEVRAVYQQNADSFLWRVSNQSIFAPVLVELSAFVSLQLSVGVRNENTKFVVDLLRNTMVATTDLVVSCSPDADIDVILSNLFVTITVDCNKNCATYTMDCSDDRPALSASALAPAARVVAQNMEFVNQQNQDGFDDESVPASARSQDKLVGQARDALIQCGSMGVLVAKATYGDLRTIVADANRVVSDLPSDQPLSATVTTWVRAAAKSSAVVVGDRAQTLRSHAPKIAASVLRSTTAKISSAMQKVGASASTHVQNRAASTTPALASPSPAPSPSSSSSTTNTPEQRDRTPSTAAPLVKVTLPPDCKPGDKLQVFFGSPPERFEFQVPENAVPNQTIWVNCSQ